MTAYSEAPTFDVASVLGDAAANSPGQTDSLLLAAADSCGLLGTAQGLVDEAAAAASKAADQAVNKIVETVGNITKSLQKFLSTAFDSIGGYLSRTFTAVNDKIKSLFDSADTDPITGEKESSFLDDFLAKVGPVVAGIKNTFDKVSAFIARAIASVTAFVTNLTNTVLGIATDLRTMACGGATSALTAVGTGVSAAFDSLAGPLSAGEAPADIIKNKHSDTVKAQASAAEADANSTNAEGATLISDLDTGVSSQLDQLVGLV